MLIRKEPPPPLPLYLDHPLALLPPLLSRPFPPRIFQLENTIVRRIERIHNSTRRRLSTAAFFLYGTDRPTR